MKNLVKSLNESVAESNTSHGKLTAKRLMTMLAEDAAMVESRPGCWEAANMADVLRGHGYSI